MSSTKPSNNQTIQAIVSSKYQSMILIIGVLLLGLWFSLSAYVLNGLYRETMNETYSWVLLNKARLEEALFLENTEAVAFRASQVADLSNRTTDFSLSVYSPDKKVLVGDPISPSSSEGLKFYWAGLRVEYFDSLYFAGRRVGFLCLKSHFHLPILVTIAVLIFSGCLGLFLAVSRLLASFLSTLDRRVVAPIETLRESMARFSVGESLADGAEVHPQMPASEVAELYEGYHALIARIREFSELEIKKAESDAEVRLAKQVAHDIRSPLAALKTVAASSTDLPEDLRTLIRLSVDRIHSIADNLVPEKKHGLVGSTDTREIGSGTIENENILILLEEILAEKRAEFSGRKDTEIRFQPTADAYPLFAQINLTEFKRVISNLLNNAVDALPPQADPEGIVEVHVYPQGAMLEIRIEDNGQGIPANVLPQLTQRGFSYNKPQGSGLGLHHARTTVEGWGGSLHIDSTMGQGTKVRLFLPKTLAPHWFVPSIQLTNNHEVVVIDDDPSIHQLWRTRVNALIGGENISLFHLHAPGETQAWLSARTPRRGKEMERPVQFLVDYEFRGSSMTGLALIESLGLERQAILVTGRSEPLIRSECNRLDVRLLPKGLVSLVPINVQGVF